MQPGVSARMPADGRSRTRPSRSRSRWPASTWSPSWWRSSWPSSSAPSWCRRSRSPPARWRRTCSIGDHLLVNKLVYSPSLGALEDDAAAARSRSSAGHVDRLQVPRGPAARLHQARDRPARRDGRDPQQGRLHRRQAARRAATCTSWSRRSRPNDPEYGCRDGRARQLGPRGGARGPALRARRQPRQQPRQPLLGLPAHATRSRAARCSSTGRTRPPARSTIARATWSGSGTPRRRSARPAGTGSST